MPDLSRIWRWVTDFQLNFAITVWWWQLEWREELTPDSITKFGWDVKIRSIKELEFSSICVVSLINWCNPSCEGYIVNCVTFESCFVFIIPVCRFIKNWIFVLKFPESFQDCLQRFQSCLEIDLRIYKRLQNQKFYPPSCSSKLRYSCK